MSPIAFDSGSIQSTLELDRTPFQQGLEQARADADRFTRDAVTARLEVDKDGADETMTRWRRDQSDRSVDVTIKADADDRSAAAAGKKVGDTASAAAKTSTASGMSGMGALIAAGVVAGAPLVGAALIGGVGAAFIGLAAVAQHSNDQIQASFHQLTADVTSQARVLTSDTVPGLTAALQLADREVQTLGPRMAGAFQAVNPEVITLTSGLVNMVNGVLPGLVNALAAGQPVALGFATMLDELGVAVGQSLTSLSVHADAFGVAFTSAGRIVADALGAVTVLVNDLGQVWANSSAGIEQGLNGVLGLVTGLASGAMPVLTEALNVVSGALSEITTFLSPLDGLLGGVAAGALVAWAAFKGAGLVTSGVQSLSEGLLGLATRLDAVAPRAATAMTGIAALGETFAGPLGIAMAAATIGLGLLANAQQQAAQRAQAHASMVQSLSSALQQSSGVIDANVRSQVAQQIQSDKSYSTFQSLGISLSQLTDIALGNTGSFNQLHQQLQNNITAGTTLAQSGEQLIPVMDGQATRSAAAQKSLDSLRTTLGDASQKNRDLTAATTGATVTMSPLQQAFQTLASSTANADQKTQSFNSTVAILIGNKLGVQQSLLSFQLQVDALSQSITNNGRTLDANTQQGQTNRQAILNAMQAALQHQQAVFQQTGSIDAATRALNTDEGALESNAVKVFGNRDAVDSLLNSVGGLPGQYAGAAAAADDFATRTGTAIGHIADKTISVNAYGTFFESWDDPVTGQRHVQTVRMNAAGGYIAGPGGPTDDRIPAMLSNGEYVVNAASTARYAPLIEAINQNRLATGGMPIPVAHFAAGGPVIGFNYNNAVDDLGGEANDWSTLVDSLAAQMMQQAMLTMAAPGPGGGVVQWAPVILQALTMLGQPASWLGTVERRMNQESGGNPNAINLWDSNAAAGTPSIGLMQVIGPTFDAYAGPLAPLGIYNPLANTYAGLNYALHRYGTLDALNQPGGYDNGGDLMPGYTVAFNGGRRPENVRTAEQEDAITTRLDRIERVLSTGAGVTVQQTFHGQQWNAEESAAAAARQMTAALRELRG